MEPDTRIGGLSDRFPDTRLSAIALLQHEESDQRQHGFNTLVAVYWKPVYKYIRLKWRSTNEEAKDLTQGFFTRALEKDFFDSFDPTRASFRTFLRACLDAYIANEHQAAHRQKRGGDHELLSLDFAAADRELQDKAVSIEDCFQQEWVRALFSVATDRLRTQYTANGRAIYWQLFERYDLADQPVGTYQQLAAEYGLPVTTVNNHLAAARRDFRRQVLTALRELTADDREFRMEARTILGRDPE